MRVPALAACDVIARRSASANRPTMPTRHRESRAIPGFPFFFFSMSRVSARRGSLSFPRVRSVKMDFRFRRESEGCEGKPKRVHLNFYLAPRFRVSFDTWERTGIELTQTKTKITG